MRDLRAMMCMEDHFNGLVQERRNSIANALELRLSCTNPSIYVRYPPSLPWGRCCASGRNISLAALASGRAADGARVCGGRRHASCSRPSRWWHQEGSVAAVEYDMHGLVQDCSIFIADALEILPSCTKPSICKTAVTPVRLQSRYYSLALSHRYARLQYPQCVTNGDTAVLH